MENAVAMEKVSKEKDPSKDEMRKKQLINGEMPE